MMTVSEIAQMTGYTPRMIQLECRQGRLRAVLGTRQEGWQIEKQDYIAWRSTFKAWRKPYKRGKPCSTSI
jgi:hypothetical protein